MSTNKNPFEIRAEMLSMAKDYMDQQYHMNIEYAQRMFDAGKKTTEDMQEAFQMYSTEELMEKAKELYKFVSTKD